jgi:ABC-type polysaccharide/polyol phosphate export permease
MIRACVQYRTLIKNLVLKDLKLKYRGSTLGVVWSLLRPLLLIGVYTLAFKYVVRIPMENYAHFLLIGVLSWNFFQGAAMASTAAIIDNHSLIKKVRFPRQTLPIATVLFNFAQFLLALGVFVPLFFLLSPVRLQWVALLFLPLLVLHLIFTIGVALLLSALTASFRDVSHLTEVGLVLVFWITPIVYPVSMVPPAYQALAPLNPLAAFAIAYQDLLFFGRLPDPGVALAVLAWTAALVGVGQLTFRWYDPAFAELV